MEKTVDVAIIGAGPAGYISAIRFAQLGKRVVLIEKEKIGGACLNHGCVPMKALLTVAKTLKSLKKGDRMGIVVSQASVDFAKVNGWNHSVMDRFRKGIEFILKSNGIETVKGSATIEANDRVLVQPQGDIINAKTIVIATGSRPSDLPGLRFDSKRIISSDDIFELKSLPKNLVIVGGGVIGVEVATAFAEMGTKVTIVEIMDQLLPGWSRDLVVPVVDSLAKMGVDINLATKVTELKYSMENVLVSLEGKATIVAEYVLVAVGRRPNTDSMNLDRIGIVMDKKGFITVNNRLETNIKGIFAAGDVTGIPYLAHRSSEQGYSIAEIASGIQETYNGPYIPAVVYSDPEVAVVGMDETEAERHGIATIIGKFAFAASARAMTMGRMEGFVKLVGEKATGKLLGAHIVGASASDLISECVLALQNSMSLEQIASAVHPHPTLSEAIMEAAKMAVGKPLHGDTTEKAR